MRRRIASSAATWRLLLTWHEETQNRQGNWPTLRTLARYRKVAETHARRNPSKSARLWTCRCDWKAGGDWHSCIPMVPFTADREMFFVQPTTYDTAPRRAIIDRDSIVIRVAGHGMSPDHVRQELDRALADVDKYL